MCPSALKDGQGIKPAVTGWSLTLLTGLKPRMVALRFIQQRTWLPVSGSKMENDFIGRLHPSDITRLYFWLGGTDSDDEGNWRWIDGTPFNFTSWESSEGSGGVQDSCLAISNRYNDYYETYWWYDYECYTLYSYICEINLDK